MDDALGPSDITFLITECNVEITCNEDSSRGVYSQEFKFTNRGLKPEEKWYYIIPFPRDRIKFIGVADKFGGLEYQLTPSEDGSESKLEFWFRQPLEPECSGDFSYSYESPLAAITVSSLFNKTTFVNCYQEFDSRCLRLAVKVSFIKGKVFTSLPVGSVDKKQKTIVFERKNLRPKETFSMTIVQQVNDTITKSGKWLIGVICAAIIGIIITAFGKALGLPYM